MVTLPSTHPTYLRGAELYNINFDANGGKINGNQDNILKTSYEKRLFSGWSEDKAGNSTFYQPNSQYEITHSCTLYA